MPYHYRYAIKQLQWLLLICFLSGITVPLLAQTPVLSFNPIISTGLSSPIDIVNPADGSGRIFIVERRGTVRFMRNGVLNDTVFLDMSSLVTLDGERGLLSMAFHPGYASNGYFFVYHTDLSGDVTIARYQVSADPNVANSASRQVLLNISHREFNNHNGGKLNFGSDGNLYFAVGDGGSANDPHFNAQNGAVLLGKMIRINVDNFTTAPYYTIPADNPYVAANDNIRDEIWAFGLRNPFRWSFDRVTNDMWIGDVGQNAREEVDFRPAGSTGGINYGWRCYEGTRSNIDSGCAPAGSYVFPVFDYDRTNLNGGQTVTGGFVYRGTAYPEMYGWYICIDYFSTNAWLIKPAGSGWTINKQSGLPTGVVAFGEADNGELYAASLNGTIFSVQAAGILPQGLLTFNGISRSNTHEITWSVAAGRSYALFEVQWSPDGRLFTTIGTVAASGGGTTYRFSHAAPADDRAFYRLKMADANGAVTYSDIIEIRVRSDGQVVIMPTIVNNNVLHIRFLRPFESVQVSDMNGKVLREIKVQGNSAAIDANLSGLAAGMYFIICRGSQGTVVNKVIRQ